jgi:hypothetical protein
MEIVELNFSKFRKGGDDSEIRLQIQVDASPADSEEDVLLFVETNTPAVFMGLFRNEITGDLIGPTIWEVEIKFGTVPPPAWMQQVAQPDWSFSIDEETVHITNALAHVKSYAASGTAPDHKGAINVQPDGAVDGTDVGVPSLTWSETLNLPYAAFGPTYLNILRNTVGCWNATAFRVWQPGELLLRKVSGKPAGLAYVQIDFTFAESKNTANFSVGAITGIDKLGWDYGWTEYEMTEDETANRGVSRPLAYHVERIRYSADFHALLLPDPFA